MTQKDALLEAPPVDAATPGRAGILAAVCGGGGAGKPGGRCSKARLLPLFGLLLFVGCFLTLRAMQSYAGACRPAAATAAAGGAATLGSIDEMRERIRFRGTNRRLPSCIIIGVRKCGTRALLEFMNMHPKVQAAHGEVHFFDSERYAYGLEWYRKRMPYSFPGQVTVEKSPAYFITDGVPERVRAMNNATRLIVVVRDPVDRAVSDYAQIHANRLAKGKPHATFEAYAVNDYGEVNTSYKAIRIGVYHRHLQRWLDVFPRTQMHVVDGDRLVVDPASELTRIEAFLGLEPLIHADNFYFNATKGFFCLRHDATERCLTDTKGRKHPAINPRVLQKLEDYYRPFNLKFYEQVGRDFNWR
ncbi:PREDICTED: heparan sulfate glucosamine 3-O-sulfotransferase 1-like [Priapulus caudatus]|uniref:Heparan sulfate glucosamine 3-O-sulfotransferase 1-like n=1 Tax=Priapulus caudatus TaxID=37621 RepID=A0ABM1EHH5_PRICU|nr:PREDICTED: heparan sulfate glucosamine 3-O-sulfotransferase 1-like [Priapulus caudatus]